MSFWDDLTGQTAANASKAAAADTYGKQQGAIGNLLGYGDQYKAGMDANYAPYVSTGLQANDQYSRLLADPSSVSSLPGYQFDLGQGIQAADRGAAARGMDKSGRTLKDLMRFGTGLADNTYGSQLSRLQSGVGIGLTGAAGQAQGLQGQLGARTMAYGGQMNAAGTIGQGDVAAANAQSAGSQNLLNAGLKIGGMALGAFGGGGPLSSLMSSYGGDGSSMSGGGGGYNPNTNMPLYSGGRPLYA